MFEEELRQAIIDSGISAYEIAKRAAARGDKCSHQAVKRFMDRKTPGLSLCTASVVADVLSLAVVRRGELHYREPPNFQLEIERRAREMAAEWLYEGFDSILRERILGTVAKQDIIRKEVAQKDYDSIKKHTDQGL